MGSWGRYSAVYIYRIPMTIFMFPHTNYAINTSWRHFGSHSFPAPHPLGLWTDRYIPNRQMGKGTLS